MSHPGSQEQFGEYTFDPPRIYRPGDTERLGDTEQLRDTEWPGEPRRPKEPGWPGESRRHTADTNPPPGVYPVPAPPDHAMDPAPPDPRFDDSFLDWRPPAEAVPSPPPRRGRLVGVLTTLVVTVSIVASVTTGLFLTQRDDRARMGRELAVARGDLNTAHRQLATARGQGKDAAEQKKIVATCLRLTFDFLNVLSANDAAGKAKAQGLLDQMRLPCERAEPYIAD